MVSLATGSLFADAALELLPESYQRSGPQAGLSVHGAIIGASYLVSVPIGVSTTAAVIAHEIPHELGNFFVLLYAGFSRTHALFAVAGTVLALAVESRAGRFSDFMLPFAAGGFIYIAGSICFPNCRRRRLGRNPCFSSLQ